MECSENGCIRPIYASGLCTRHHRYWLIEKAPKCAVEACDGKGWRSGGVCEKHYREQKKKTAATCSVDGCERVVVALGLCQPHYQRQLNHGHLDPTRPTDWGGRKGHPLYDTWKWIRRRSGQVEICDEWLSDFWTFVRDMGDRPSSSHMFKRRDRSKPYGPANCYWAKKEITFEKALNIKDYQRRWHKQYRANHPEKHRDRELKRRLGISADEFDRLYAEQNGKCAICSQSEQALHPTTHEPRALAVDHCHTGGHVRGLLCTWCNRGIAYFHDKPELLHSAIAYLERHRPASA